MRPPSGLRERKKQKTRDAIVAAALELFRAKGFDATSVDEIAAAADVSSRTFFRYFPTKEDVVFLDQAHEDAAFAGALAVVRPGESDLDRLERAALAVASTIHKNRDFLADLYPLARATPTLVARMLRMQLESEEAIVGALLGRGRASRQRVVRVRMLAACAVAAVRAAHVAWIEAGARAPAGQIVADAMAVLRQGFEPPPTRPGQPGRAPAPRATRPGRRAEPASGG